MVYKHKCTKYSKTFDLALVYINQVYFDDKWSSVLDIALNTLEDHTVSLSSYTKNINNLRIDSPVYSIGYPDYGGGSTVQAEGVIKELFIAANEIDENLFSKYVSLSDLPAVDLFIRTGGEHRISNFLLWQCAYSELYFTDVLWPDFSDEEFIKSLQWFSGRQRRFGRTGEQLEENLTSDDLKTCDG